MNQTDVDLRSVEAHYDSGTLGDAILSALVATGKDPERLQPEDLAPLDEFHIRGRRATLELAERTGLETGMQVLDVGCGLGGPARLLAQRFGCRVTGIDLSRSYCRVADMLSRLVGLAGHVAFRQGDALKLPFGDGVFDVAWTQHAAMNIPDKLRLYRELRRVLKKEGRVALYDICAGEGGPVHFPVPWAGDASISHLATPKQLRQDLESAGFELLGWRDTTAEGLAWFGRAMERIEAGAVPPLGLHLLLGERYLEMMGNQLRNLQEGRITLVEAVGRLSGDIKDS